MKIMENLQNENAVEMNLENSSQMNLEQIKNLKSKLKALEESTVSKEEYANLLDAYVNGDNGQHETDEVKVCMSPKEFKEKVKFLDSDIKDVDFIKTILELREDMIARGCEDPALPKQHNHAPTEQDYEITEKSIEYLKECLDASEGAGDTFRLAFQQGLKDPIIRRK